MRKYLPLASVILAAGILAAPGCQSARNANIPVISPARLNQQIEQREIRTRLMAFVDRYIARVEEATDLMISRTDSPEERVQFHATKYYSATALIALAADYNPRLGMINTLAILRLENTVWAGEFGDQFGENAVEIRRALSMLEADIWGVAADYFTRAELDSIRELTDAWREEHPDAIYVSTVRLDEILRIVRQRRATMLDRLSLPTIGGVTGIGDATRAVGDVQDIAERALFISQRAPLILGWQVELTLYELATQPEILELQTLAERSVSSVEEVTAFIQTLPQEIETQREAALAEVEAAVARQRSEAIAEVAAAVAAERESVFAELTTTLDTLKNEEASARELVVSVESLLAQLNITIESLDRLFERFESDEPSEPAEPKEPGRPFDIREYTETAERLTLTLTELNKTIESAERIIGSDEIDARLDAADQLAKKQFRRLGFLLVAAFAAFWGFGLIALVAYRAIRQKYFH